MTCEVIDTAHSPGLSLSDPTTDHTQGGTT